MSLNNDKMTFHFNKYRNLKTKTYAGCVSDSFHIILSRNMTYVNLPLMDTPAVL